MAAGDQGLWTGALSILLGPVGAPWGVAYRLSGSRLERVASEGVPLSLRGHLEAFDVGLQAGLAVCRAVRTRRAVSDERMFAAVVDAGEAEQLEAAGIGAATAVPVAHGSSVVGVLVVGASMRDGMEADALTFLDAVAALLAPAVGAADAGRLPVSEDRRSSSAPPRASVAAEAAARKAADVGRAAVEAVGQCGGFLRRAGIDVRVAAEEGCLAVGEGAISGWRSLTS
ncbi:MAG: GAF domain-containing protein [Polyangiaceae bacterium]